MITVYTGMLTPEKMGVSGSKWMVLEGDTLIVTNLRDYPFYIEHLKACGCEIILVDTDVARKMAEGFM